MNPFRRTIALVLLLACCTPALPLAAADTRTATAADAEPPRAPDQCGDLLASLAASVRPQWRLYYRATGTRPPKDRNTAALAMGALVADLSLACEARDAQQFRNLLIDLAAMELMLGIAEDMESTKQKLTTQADEGEWKTLREDLGSLVRKHRRELTAHRDEALADLQFIGLWIRAWQITVQFCRNQPSVTAPPLGRPDYLAAIRMRTESLAEAGCRHAAAIRKPLRTLERLWDGTETPATERPARLSRSTELLDELMLQQTSPGPR